MSAKKSLNFGLLEPAEVVAEVKRFVEALAERFKDAGKSEVDEFKFGSSKDGVT